jgi:hypothetical protein
MGMKIGVMPSAYGTGPCSRETRYPGRSKAVVGHDEEAMGGEKKERFQEA